MQQQFSDRADNSETLGIRALGFLIKRPADFAHFLATSGLTQAELMHAPYNRDQLSSALEFLLVHEGILSQFSLMTGRSVEAVYEAWRSLARGSWPHRAPPAVSVRSWRMTPHP